MTLGERIRQARTHAGLTQVQLAELASMKQQVLSRLENGHILQTVAIVRIATACGVRPEWLDAESGPMLAQDALAHVPAAQRDLFDAAIHRVSAAPLDPVVLGNLESALRLTAREPVASYTATAPPISVPLKRRATR